MRQQRRWLHILILMAALALMAVPVTAQESGEDTSVTIVRSGEVMTEDLVLLNGLAHIEEGATVEGEVAMMTGELLIEGHVLGDVVAFGGAVTLGPTARIEGDVIAFGALEQHPDAIVVGRVTRATDEQGAEDALSRLLDQVPGGLWLREQASGPVPRGPQWLASRFGFLLLALLATWALAITLPQNINHITEIMTHSALLSVGTGMLTLVVVALLGTFMSVICIGLPVALVLGLGLLAALVLGWASTSALLGDYLSGLLHLRIDSKALRAVIGCAIITIVAVSPWLGFLVVLAAACWSVGAVLLTRFGTRRDSQWAADLGRKVTGSHSTKPAAGNKLDAMADATGFDRSSPPSKSPTRDTRKLSGDAADAIGDMVADDLTP